MSSTNEITPAGVFSVADVGRAQRALNAYMYEINGAGLRWEFDGWPSNMEFVLDRAADHHRETGRFRRRVQAFGALVAGLETFRNRPVTHPHPMAWDKRYPKTATRNIGDSEINTYRRMHEALVRYDEALRQHGPNSAEARQAAHAVTYTVQPEVWRETGAAVPEDVVPYTTLATRWYLEAVISASAR